MTGWTAYGDESEIYQRSGSLYKTYKYTAGSGLTKLGEAVAGGGGFSPTLLYTKNIGYGETDFPSSIHLTFGMTTGNWYLFEYKFFDENLYEPRCAAFVVQGGPSFAGTFNFHCISQGYGTMFAQGNNSNTSITTRIYGNPNHIQYSTGWVLKIYKL